MPKELIYGAEARRYLLEGVDFVADAVKVTMGPKGRCVSIGRRLLDPANPQPPLVTRDGVTVANYVDSPDRRIQIGSDLAREAANRTVYACGDGTTTSTVLVQGMVHAGVNFIDAGVSPWELKTQMDAASEQI